MNSFYKLSLFAALCCAGNALCMEERDSDANPQETFASQALNEGSQQNLRAIWLGVLGVNTTFTPNPTINDIHRVYSVRRMNAKDEAEAEQIDIAYNALIPLFPEQAPQINPARADHLASLTLPSATAYQPTNISANQTIVQYPSLVQLVRRTYPNGNVTTIVRRHTNQNTLTNTTETLQRVRVTDTHPNFNPTGNSSNSGN